MVGGLLCGGNLAHAQLRQHLIAEINRPHAPAVNGNNVSFVDRNNATIFMPLRSILGRDADGWADALVEQCASVRRKYAQGLAQIGVLENEVVDELFTEMFPGSPGPFEAAFANSVRRFLERLDASRHDLQAEGLVATENFTVLGMRFTGSDPHGEDLGGVVIFSIEDGFNSFKKLVYKPSSVDGHYWVQGSQANPPSLTTLLNNQLQQANIATRLKTFKVLRRADIVNGLVVSKYGFVEFIPNQPRLANQAKYDAYSYRAGLLTAVAYVAGLDDLHIENVMIKDAHPYLIDAETAFRPTQFTVASTLLFGDDNGAFRNTQRQDWIRLGKDPNSIAIYNGVNARPNYVQLEAGFLAALTQISNALNAQNPSVYEV
jgi:hypothetical protein